LGCGRSPRYGQNFEVRPSGVHGHASETSLGTGLCYVNQRLLGRVDQYGVINLVRPAERTLGLGRSFELSAVGAFDEHAFAAGGAVRFIPLRLRRLAAGAEAELGFAWAALALPIAVSPLTGLWLYTTPRLGNMGIHLTPGLPAGVSLELFDGWAVRAEAQVSWQEFLAYQRRVHLAGGVAYQW
jgi:hypothetical protein